MGKEASPAKVVQEIRRKTRRRCSAEEKIRIVLEGLRGEESIATFCRTAGLAPNLSSRWSKGCLEAGKRRLVGDTSREATAPEVSDLRKAHTACSSASPRACSKTANWGAADSVIGANQTPFVRARRASKDARPVVACTLSTLYVA